MAVILSNRSLSNLCIKIYKLQPALKTFTNITEVNPKLCFNPNGYKLCNIRDYSILTFSHAFKEKSLTNTENLLKNKDYYAVPTASFKSRKKDDPFLKTNYYAVPTASFKSRKKDDPFLKTKVEIPENPQLPIYLKAPAPIIGLPALKHRKLLRYIRGEEEVHRDFIHGQYGIVALRGGMLKIGHFEMIRNEIRRRIDNKRAFAIWRVEAPWLSHTKKGIGKRMGMGKGSIKFYTTPIKARRVIVEVAGNLTFAEVQNMLRIVAEKLPFPAAVMTQEMIEEQRKEEERLERENINPFTFKFVMQNNMLGSKIWAKREMDMKYFGKYD